eukprot:1336675-Amphidinium_carterae.1
MAPHRQTEEKIQKHKNDALRKSQRSEPSEGPPSGLRAEGGTHGNMSRKRTSFVLFDMVAELAIAER